MGEVPLQGYRQLLVFASEEATKPAACFQNAGICSDCSLASCGVKAKVKLNLAGHPCLA